MALALLHGRYRASILSASGLFLAIILILLYNVFWSEQNAASLGTAKPLFLGVLIPGAVIPDVEICKTVLTSQVLNYPVPVIIPPTDVNTKDDGAARNRLAPILSYLRSLPPEAEDGIIILLDGPGVLFQLRPDVLLHRYFRLLRKVNDGLEGSETTRKGSVVLPIQSACSADSENLACRNVVPAPGPGGYGTMIGPAKDIKSILQKALTKPHVDLRFVFADIFEEQQLHRPAQSQVETNWWRSWLEGWSIQSRQAGVPVGINVQHEFGIVVDRSNELSRHVTPGDKWKLSKSSPELRDSAPPFWTVSGAEEDLPHTSGWDEVELCTIDNTGKAPAILYHPGPEGDLRTQMWKQLWLHPHARTLYDAAQLLPAAAVARVVNADGAEQVFWNRRHKSNKAGAFWYGGGEQKWAHFWDICSARAQSKEIFRDGLGEWEGTVSFGYR